MQKARRNLAIKFWACCLLLPGGALLRAQAPGACENQLPPQARKAVASKWKSWKVLTSADLPGEVREIWEDDYEEKCPGVAAGQFSPRQPRSYAVTLVRSRNGALYQALVLVVEKNHRYQVSTLAPSRQTATPSIVRRLPPGSYSSLEGAAEIEAAFDVIAYEAIEAGSTIYYWSNNKYRNLTISE